MNVLMVVMRGQTAGYGGAARQAISLCRLLNKRGINTLVLTSGTHKDSDVKIKPVCSSLSGIWGKISFPVALFFQVISRAGKFDIIHIHGAYWMSFGAVLAAKIRRKPVLIKLSMFGEDDPLTITKEKFSLRGFGFLTYLELKWATKIICISRELADAYRRSKFSLEKMVEIPNGVDTERFRPLAEEEKNFLKKKLGFELADKLVAFQGSVSLRKGIDVLLKVWPSIYEKNPEAKLLLLGPVDKTLATKDNFFEYAKNFIDEEIFKKSIVVAGLVSQEKIIEYFQIADLFVLPSIREGLPNSLLEAMSSGLPSVATAIGGMNDLIVSGRNGFVFSKGDIDEFLQHCLAVLEDKDLSARLAMAARQTIVEKFSLASVALEYQGLYNKVNKR